MIRLILVAALVAPLPAAAKWSPAAEKRLSRDYHRCMDSGDAARGVTSAMNDCTGAEIDRQDARLNQAYVMVMRRLPAARKAALRTSERGWIRQRDATCKRAGRAAGGGSASGTEYAGCFLNETIKRTMWLERYR